MLILPALLFAVAQAAVGMASLAYDTRRSTASSYAYWLQAQTSSLLLLTAALWGSVVYVPARLLFASKLPSAAMLVGHAASSHGRPAG